MEKRVFLATALSFAILLGWSVLFPPPKKAIKTEVSQVVENKEIASRSAVQESLPQVVAPAQDLAEDIVTAETNWLKLEFSNKGGKLKSVFLKKYNTLLPISDFVSIDSLKSAVFKVESNSSNEIIYSTTSQGLIFQKVYSWKDNQYIVHSETRVKNISAKDVAYQPETNAILLDMEKYQNGQNSSDPHFKDRSYFEYVILTEKESFRKNNAFNFEKDKKREGADKVEFVGFRTRYFCAVVLPEYETQGYIFDPQNKSQLYIDLKSAPVTLTPSDEKVYSYKIYAGPEDLATLQSYDSGFEKIRKYYRARLFDGISKIIYSILHALHKAISNWGICIILISVIIFGATYPLTFKSMMSMRKMQLLQPKITALRDKYKDNPQKLNKEIMDLYRVEKINPLGGCLPMLLQMPVFIGLYQVLYRDVSFKGANFLWIKDLAEPDRLFMLPAGLPIKEFNILPILMVVVMYFQQKMNSKSMVATDEAQIAQQKMMMVIMPIFLGFIFYNFASGLNLYFTMFYLMSTLAQWKMTKTT